MARHNRHGRRWHRKQRNRLFTKQLIEYLTNEKKLQEQEKISDISERLEKVLVSETKKEENRDNRDKDQQEVQNILRNFTI